MTNRRRLYAPVAFALCVLLVLTVGACGDSPGSPSDDDDDDDPAGLPNGTMSAQFDGGPWNANLLIAPLLTSIGFGLQGIDTANRSIVFTVSATTPGVYPIAGPVSVSCVLAIGSQGWFATTGVQGSGQISFTTLTQNRAIGAFTCTAPATPGTGATGTKEIVNGQFNVTY